MDWLLATPQLHSTFSSLGSFEQDSYVINPNALSILEEINYKLTYEDQTLRTFRRAIGFGQNVRSDLIPLLENAKESNVLDSVIRILVNLTVPVECLFSVDIMYRTELGRHTIFELNKLLYMSKEAFTDAKSTKPIVEYMKFILESEVKLSPQKCDQINNCLLLLRNILHIPDTNANFIMPMAMTQLNCNSMQNTIIWNLFIQSIDKLMLHLMTCPQRSAWGVTMVQLIALIYKDQHVCTLQKLLNIWFEASLSESSEDNESNTSPPKEGSVDSSPMLTSDPTSDSSDNGSGSGVCKNSHSDERRQAMREEATEATLQEVSRLGHEYQNSILRIEAEAENTALELCYIEQPMVRNVDIEDVTTILRRRLSDVAEADDAEERYYAERNSQQQKLKDQPANKTNNYVTTTDNTFKPPAPIQPKVESSTHHAEKVLSPAVKLGQKSPHSGQLHLTKGVCCPQKRECPSSQSEHSDCGYGTQVENQESISTSSNEDEGPHCKPPHQKPPCSSKLRNKPRITITLVDNKDLRRKRLVKRSKSSLINMKGLVQHLPTDDDISNLLKEFTVDFLLKGYGHLVDDLHVQLLTEKDVQKVPIDTSHFFWLLTYFLKFAVQLELDFEHIGAILTFDIISYLTYEGVTLCEQFELSVRQQSSDLKPYVRRMHLVVTAIREFLQALQAYEKITHLSEDDRSRLRLLMHQVSMTEDLRSLFVLLLRRYNTTIQSKQYLQDLIVTNHLLLLVLDATNMDKEACSVKLVDHISQFATVEVMHYYGLLLEDFSSNGEFVNDCIFTMLHHVSGDLAQISLLFQPVILKAFSRIWEAEYELCDDWSDLIEYVIHKFIKTPQKNAMATPTASLTEMTKEHNMENTVCTWSQEERDTLYWYYVQSKKTNDVVGKISKLLCSNGNKFKSRISIIQQLLEQDIITLVEYDDLMKFEDAEYQRSMLVTTSSIDTESGIDVKENSFGKPSDDMQILLDLIVKEKKSHHLVWLQKILLECCYIKLMLKTRKPGQLKDLSVIMEPVAYQNIFKNHAVPIVQWNNDQATTMLYQPFVLLLHKLGLQLPADAGSRFARIPSHWTLEKMYDVATKLGTLDKLTLKFDPKVLGLGAGITRVGAKHARRLWAARGSVSSGISSLDTEHSKDREELALIPEGLECQSESSLNSTNTNTNSEMFAVPKTKHANSIIRFTPEPSPPPHVPNWLQLVMRSKCNPQKQPAPSKLNNPLNEESIDSDASMSNAQSKAFETLVASTEVVTHERQPPPKATIVARETLPMQPAMFACLTMPNSNYNEQSSVIKSSKPAGVFKSPDVPNSSVSLSSAAAVAAAAAVVADAKACCGDGDDDAVMRSIEIAKPSAAAIGVSARIAAINLQAEYSAIVATVCKENDLFGSDNVSIASDLTRMYVSDEEEKQEAKRLAHFH